MRELDLRYLDKKVAQSIKEIIEDYIGGKAGIDSEKLIHQIHNLTPIQKTDPNSVRCQVEGLYVASELLWHTALNEMKDKSRQDLVKLAKLKTLSHYHYLTGSRENLRNVLTRDDYLTDPPTALVKLRDDIIGLAKIVLKNKQSTAVSD